MDQYSKYLELLPPLLIAFLISFLVTPLIGFIANKLDIVDKPKSLRDNSDPTAERRIHDRIVPKLGGLASSLPLLFLLPFFAPITLQSLGIILGLIIVMVAGALDDKKELSSKKQFLLFITLPIIAVLTGTIVKGFIFDGWFSVDILGPLNLNYFNTNITLYGLAVVLTILWIMGVTYSVKMTDGVDGVLTGTSAIATLIITLVAVREGSTLSAVMGAIFLGGLLGFFPYNFYPAKIFNGCGDIINGYLIAVLAITSQVKASILLMIILLPIMDFALVLWGRSQRRHPKSIKEYLDLLSTGDKTHLHHRLLDSGLNFKQVAYFEYFIMAAVGMVAFLISGLNFTLAIFSSFTIILLTFFIVKWKLVKKNKEDAASNKNSKNSKEDATKQKSNDTTSGYDY